MPQIKRRTSLVGAGCFLQGLGLASLVTAVLSVPTLIGPFIFGILGLWLLVYGGQRSIWFECTDCGTKLANRKLRVCPACRGEFR